MVRIVYDMPFEEYAEAPGINASLLKMVHSLSLKHVKAVMDGERKHESDAMDFGKCFHSLLLENREDFVERPDTYPAPPDHAKVKSGEIASGDHLKWNANAGYCKIWENSQGKIILTSSECAEIRGMVSALRGDTEIAGLLRGKTEVSVFAEKDGVPVKCRIDLLTSEEYQPVIDFKSTRSAQPESFLVDSFNRGYHIQAAWNLDVLRWAGIPRKSFWFVPVEGDAPFAHSVLKFNDEAGSFLRYGRTLCRSAFAKIGKAMKTGEWPSYGSHDAELHAKPWMLPMIDQTA
jgi:hypothetical protein